MCRQNDNNEAFSFNVTLWAFSGNYNSFLSDTFSSVGHNLAGFSFVSDISSFVGHILRFFVSCVGHIYLRTHLAISGLIYPQFKSIALDNMIIAPTGHADVHYPVCTWRTCDQVVTNN